jgi:hypothetical protein
MSTYPINLPSYFSGDKQDDYNQELNQTLREWFNSDGFVQPSLTAAEVALLLALTPAVQPPKTWFNSTLGKLQVLVAVGTVETVTSV